MDTPEETPLLNESFDVPICADNIEGVHGNAIQTTEVAMASVVQDWRSELIEVYPDLFHPIGNPTATLGFPEVGDGWRDLLQRACIRIQAAIRIHGGRFCATQIKEKFGTLRFYWDGTLSLEGTRKVKEAIHLAEARSACTCEICGEVGRLYGSVWLTTRCTAHAEKQSLVNIRPGFENLYIEKRFDRDPSKSRWWRYDRDTDSFVEVIPVAPGIEET